MTLVRRVYAADVVLITTLDLLIGRLLSMTRKVAK